MADTPELSETQTPRNPAARRVILTVLGAAVLGGAWYGYGYYTHGQYQQETNDAQVQADSLTVSSRVSGYVTDVQVQDNQDVAAGAPLLRLDPRDYRAKTDQASAQIAMAQALQANAQSAMAEQQAAIEQARAQLASAQAKAQFDADQVKRFAPLVASGAEQAQQLAQLRTAADQSAAQVRAQSAMVEAQQRRLSTLEAQVRQAGAQGQGGAAQLSAANVDLAATQIRATMAGRVGDKSVTVGQYVTPGMRLMSIVPLDKLYVVANFKETQMALVRPGQPVTIKVDALEGKVIKGRVASIAPGTGASFSLIPPANATGNFTKIVQRVPVRIEIEATPAIRRLLVPGLSVTASIDTISARDEAAH
ncbi:HlyD family efflux transporter periplasmic adaptor subunit [Novosphingobium sp. FSY-8]|uniref:HlyD family efflux transporter periplasmic adaptor subunit n=1 Tax=Novosphingobium ovatum TaxID=1908523 RepID=A0ABW9XHT4_9SPHN|nr:HlyD family secretion protein [Novosphingobium ovatum]NBC38127.1 HlyD family efflux transporter periplasmic adaptor subunit [Novosphingobium ovatum]